MVPELVTIVSVNPSSGYGVEARTGGSFLLTQNGDGPGNSAGGVGIRYEHGMYDYCPANTEGRRVVRAFGSSVAGMAADSNGEGGIGVSRKVAPCTLCCPARAVLHPSESTVH